MPKFIDESVLLQTDAYKLSYDGILDRTSDQDGLKYREVLDNESKGKGEDERVQLKEQLYGEIAHCDSTDSQLFYSLLNGKRPIGVKVPKIGEAMKDFMSNRDFPFIFSPAIEVMMKNYIMPHVLVSTEVFQTIPYTGQKDQINIRTLGPIEIEEVGLGEPYPEVGSSIMDKSYRMALSIKKYGVKLGMENELINSDHWGVLGFLATQIADGFVMHKEMKCMNLLNRMGITIFNNKTPSAGTEKKITSGRDIDGSFNGTLSLNDIMTVHTYGATRGFNYRVMLMHPFSWQMFVTNPELREIVLQGTNVQSALSNSNNLQGSQAPGFKGPFGEMWGLKMSGLGGSNNTQPYYSPNNALDPYYGKLGISPASDTLSPYGATFNVAPGDYWPGGLRVIVTPHVPFKQDTTSLKYISNLYFIDPSKTGVILQGEGPTTDEWEDIEREIKYIKFKNKFGLAAIYQGRGVAVVRNLVIDRSYVFDNVNQVSLSPYGVGSPIAGVDFSALI